MRHSLTVLLALCIAKAAIAQEEAATQQRNEIFEKITAISKDLKPEEASHFEAIYTNYGLINTVRTVQSEISKGIKACGQENPAMKPSLDKDFSEWNAAVNPMIGEAKGHLDNMVLAQDYADKEDIKQIFTLMEDTRKQTQNQTDKTPVTTHEACEYLQTTLTQTQETMLGLLRQTLISLPQ